MLLLQLFLYICTSCWTFTFSIDVSNAPIKAVGQPFEVGMLYNAKTNTLVPGITLWERAIIDRDLVYTEDPESHFQLNDDSAAKDMLWLLDISGEIKLDLWGGRIKIEGRTKLMWDQRDTNHEAHVYLTYRCRSHTKELTMKQLSPDKIAFTDVLQTDLATHVVTAVKYVLGAEVTFDFYDKTVDHMDMGNFYAAFSFSFDAKKKKKQKDKQLEEEKKLEHLPKADDKQDTKTADEIVSKTKETDKLETSDKGVKKKGGSKEKNSEKSADRAKWSDDAKFRFNASAQVTMDDSHQTNNLSVKFNGDFVLESNPDDLDSAKQVFNNLGILLGNSKNKFKGAVAQEVWLLPIEKLTDKYLSLLFPIGEQLVSRSQDIFDMFQRYKRLCGDLKQLASVRQFLKLSSDLQTFETRLNSFWAMYARRLSEALPNARSGPSGELVLAKLLNDVSLSPFEDFKLKKFTDGLVEEAEVLQAYLSAIEPPIKIALSEANFQAIRNDINYDHVVTFTFKVFRQKESPFLRLAERYLADVSYEGSLRQLVANWTKKAIRPWHRYPHVINSMLRDMRRYISFAKANSNDSSMVFAVANDWNKDKKSPGSHDTQDYEDSVAKPFVCLPAPSKLHVNADQFDKVVISWDEMVEHSNDIVDKYYVQYRMHNATTNPSVWHSLGEFPGNSRKIELSLDSSTTYVVSVYATHKQFGRSSAGESAMFTTGSEALTPLRSCNNVIYEAVLECDAKRDSFGDVLANPAEFYSRAANCVAESPKLNFSSFLVVAARSASQFVLTNNIHINVCGVRRGPRMVYSVMYGEQFPNILATNCSLSNPSPPTKCNLISQATALMTATDIQAVTELLQQEHPQFNWIFVGSQDGSGLSCLKIGLPDCTLHLPATDKRKNLIGAVWTQP